MWKGCGEEMRNLATTEQECEHNILLNGTQKELEHCNTFYIAACHLIAIVKPKIFR